MASIYDMLTFSNLRNNKYNLGDNQNLPNNQNNSGLQWWMNADRSRYPSPMMPGMLDPTGQMGASNYQDLGNATVDESRIPGRIQEELPTNLGIMTNFKNKLSGFRTPAMDFMKKIAGQRSPEKQAAYDAITGGKSLGSGQWTTGMYGGNEYDLYNSPSGLKVGSDILGRGQGYEKNFDSMFGSKSLEEMEQKKLDWALGRYNKLGRKGLGTRIYNELAKSGMIDDQIRSGADTVAPVQTDRQKIEAYTGRGMSDYRASRPSSERSFTGYGKSGMGRDPSDRMAQGGRIGYQEGELVEDEYMAEATPAGMMEENVETVQGEPSREQLEVIALEIFRLPLEELNEEQLNVVYQAAMEQEPSEEEVQFAAQEGPGEGIASLV